MKRSQKKKIKKNRKLNRLKVSLNLLKLKIRKFLNIFLDPLLPCMTAVFNFIFNSKIKTTKRENGLELNDEPRNKLQHSPVFKTLVKKKSPSEKIF